MYADSLEGANYLLNRFPVREALVWQEKILPLFLGKQQDNGIVEGWYGDGNYARTALLVARYYTQGTLCHPWRPDLRFGAMSDDGGRLALVLTADKNWSGKLILDQPRHRLNLNLPVNYPRLNEWPEWFTVEADRHYRVKMDGVQSELKTGAELAQGLVMEGRRGKCIVLKFRSIKSSHFCFQACLNELHYEISLRIAIQDARM
ncbi:MAG: hypothetical protein U0V70_19750 [Terriglobia bacterium]